MLLVSVSLYNWL